MISFAALFTEFPGKNASEKNKKNTEIASLKNISRKKNVIAFLYVKCPQLVFMGKPYPENGLRFWRVDCSLGFKYFHRKKAVPWTILIYLPHPCWIFSRRGHPAHSSQSLYVFFLECDFILSKAYSIDILYTRSSLDASLI